MLKFPSHLFLTTFFAAIIVSTGCEQRRYQPADWRKATAQTLAERKAKKNRKPAAVDLQAPTDWMELTGTGGEAIPVRNYRPPNVRTGQRGMTLPSRRSDNTLPARAGGNTLPNRKRRTAIGNRPATTLPNRNTTNTTLPAR